jgi:glycosyltransferase involved in cell wall biosynthesis
VVLYLDTPENAEVAGGVGIAFTAQTLAEKMGFVLKMSIEERRELGARAMARVEERYSWDAVTARYEELLGRMGRKGRH